MEGSNWANDHTVTKSVNHPLATYFKVQTIDFQWCSLFAILSSLLEFECWENAQISWSFSSPDFSKELTRMHFIKVDLGCVTHEQLFPLLTVLDSVTYIQYLFCNTTKLRGTGLSYLNWNRRQDKSTLLYWHTPPLHSFWWRNLSCLFVFFLSYLPTPSLRAGYDTRSIFKWSLTGLNSEFTFS